MEPIGFGFPSPLSPDSSAALIDSKNPPITLCSKNLAMLIHVHSTPSSSSTFLLQLQKKEKKKKKKINLQISPSLQSSFIIKSYFTLKNVTQIKYLRMITFVYTNLFIIYVIYVGEIQKTVCKWGFLHI